jgi:hypothetical protein
MKNRIFIIGLISFLFIIHANGQIVNESYVLSSGSEWSSGGTSGHFGVLGEELVSSSITGGTVTGSVGFLNRFFILQLTGIDLALFLEGPYQTGGSMLTGLADAALLPNAQPFNTLPWSYAGTETAGTFPVGVVDWILVELRDAPTAETAYPATVVDGWPKAMFVKSDGSVVDTLGNQPSCVLPEINDSLFVVIRHRNHLAVMSSHAMTLTADTYNYDFTDALAKAFGNGAGYKELEAGAFGLVAGDADADGSVFMSDRALWRANLGLTLTYLPTDFDMDASTFMSDRTLWRANIGTANPISGMFVSPLFVSQVPPEKK